MPVSLLRLHGKNWVDVICLLYMVTWKPNKMTKVKLLSHSFYCPWFAWLLINFSKCILLLLSTVYFCTFALESSRCISLINTSLPLPKQIFQNKAWFHFFCSSHPPPPQGNSALGKALLGKFQGSKSGHLNYVLIVYLLAILKAKNFTVNLKGSRLRLYPHINRLGEER